LRSPLKKEERERHSSPIEDGKEKNGRVVGPQPQERAAVASIPKEYFESAEEKERENHCEFM